MNADSYTGTNHFIRTERHKSAIGCVCAVLDDRQFASFVSFPCSKTVENPTIKWQD